MKTAKNKNTLGLLVAILAILVVVHRVTMPPRSSELPAAPAPLAPPVTVLPMEKRSSPVPSTTISIYAPESPAQPAAPAEEKCAVSS